MLSFNEAMAANLDLLRPQILAAIEKSGSGLTLYLHWKGLGHAVKHFENRKGGNSKFWKVYPPYKLNENMWGVRVEFGKIGTLGQTRVHAEQTEDIAWRYYHEKLVEKQRKGYVQSGASNDSAKLKAIQASAKRKLKKPECSHATLTVAGKNKWKCGTCSTVIEFGKSLMPKVEEVNEAIRHIDLGGLE